jgi:hypothetical protein
LKICAIMKCSLLEILLVITAEFAAMRVDAMGIGGCVMNLTLRPRAAIAIRHVLDY